jgi:hypothetical protein
MGQDYEKGLFLITLAELLRKIDTRLKKMQATFIFSGAIAANVYRTIPRATMDLDIAIPFDNTILDSLKRNFQDFEILDWELLKKRLAIKKEHPEVIVPEILKLKHPSGFEVDFFPLYSPYLLRKRTAKIEDFSIDVIGPEDLILLKSFFNRYKDRDDIVNILENSNLKLDLKYIIDELQEIGNNEIITLVKRIRINEFK